MLCVNSATIKLSGVDEVELIYPNKTTIQNSLESPNKACYYKPDYFYALIDMTAYHIMFGPR